MLVMLEYSNMMGKILEYLNTVTRGPYKFDQGDSSSKKEESM